ncbi:MAG TPA: carbohydrate-binding family 9-like protein [Mucilaginibacter sp.]
MRPVPAKPRLVKIIKAITIAAALTIPLLANAQKNPFAGLENLFTVPESYVAKFAVKPPVIDGDVNDESWQKVKWSKDFGDIEGDQKPKPPYKTSMKMLWDDSCLYIAAQLKEPHVWANFTHHDDVVYHENDFELFIDPNGTTHSYYEIEVNALNTIFDLFLNKPYRDRGRGLTGWEAIGLRSAVKVQGTLNNPDDTDEGWTVELAIPFKALTGGFNPKKPGDGSIYRINFSRVEYDMKIDNGRYVKLKDSSGRNLPEHNWSWSPQGEIAMHTPEHWGYLLFSKSEDDVKFTMPYGEEQKRYLWLVYYRQKLWYSQHHEYTASLKKLGIKKRYEIMGSSNTIKLAATETQFAAFITDNKTNITYTINHEGFIEQLNPDRNE